jgi:flavin-dependent dehydrogenase
MTALDLHAASPETSVAVIGAGPAGCTLAARLAQLGHDVTLIERSTFPRPHLGESLSPGVLPLLASTGARAAIEAAGVRRVSTVDVRWGRGAEQRHDVSAAGRIVDRGQLDHLLLEHARSLGVRVLQPARLVAQHADPHGWQLGLEVGGRRVALRARFVADATGRARNLGSGRHTPGCRTLAVYAYWRGRGLPARPCIEAGADAWYWGVPLPDGTCNTLAFVDLDRASRGRPVAERLRELLQSSVLLAGCRDATLVGPVRAVEATPSLSSACVTATSIRVGDAALAIDPLSSTGVQKAIQTALAGAIVVNTLVRRPERHDAAMRFYQEMLGRAFAQHRGWAAWHYREVAAGTPSRFWQDRAAGAREPDPPPAGDAPGIDVPLALSPHLEIVVEPCLDDEFVSWNPAVRHPGLDGPVAFVGGVKVAPLLGRVRPGMTPLEMAQDWSRTVPLPLGLSISRWLVTRGVLVPVTDPSERARRDR